MCMQPCAPSGETSRNIHLNISLEQSLDDLIFAMHEKVNDEQKRRFISALCAIEIDALLFDISQNSMMMVMGACRR